mmetsp:Transcript_41086/g.62201  ORF Transcript_41086/g.62201 Transcript_41086/m.62201 type:complete len:90 (-) Transcript_41086:3042-3311(-)
MIWLIFFLSTKLFFQEPFSFFFYTIYKIEAFPELPVVQRNSVRHASLHSDPSSWTLLRFSSVSHKVEVNSELDCVFLSEWLSTFGREVG